MKTEKIAVTMTDGRTVGFGASQKVRKEILITAGRPTGIRFDGSNGETFIADFADLPDASWIGMAEADSVSVWATAHGYSQKLGDEYAALGSTSECMGAVRDLWKRLLTGAWDSEARGFGASSVLLEAVLLAFPGNDRDEARKTLSEMNRAEQLALQLTKEVKPHFDALQAAKAKGANIAALTAKFQK